MTLNALSYLPRLVAKTHKLTSKYLDYECDIELFDYYDLALYSLTCDFSLYKDQGQIMRVFRIYCVHTHTHNLRHSAQYKVCDIGLFVCLAHAILQSVVRALSNDLRRQEFVSNQFL